MDFQKYNIKEKKKKKEREKNQSHKNYNIYVHMKFAFKKESFFFCKVIVGYKSEN